MNSIKIKFYCLLILITFVFADCRFFDRQEIEYQLEFDVIGPILLCEAIKNIDNIYYNNNSSNYIDCNSMVYVATIKNTSKEDAYIFVDSLGSMIPVWCRYYLGIESPKLIGGQMPGHYHTISDTLKPGVQRAYYFTLDLFKYDYVILFPDVRSTSLDSLNNIKPKEPSVSKFKQPYYIYLVRNKSLITRVDKRNFSILINNK